MLTKTRFASYVVQQIEEFAFFEYVGSDGKLCLRRKMCVICGQKINWSKLRDFQDKDYTELFLVLGIEGIVSVQDIRYMKFGKCQNNKFKHCKKNMFSYPEIQNLLETMGKLRLDIANPETSPAFQQCFISDNRELQGGT